MQRLTAGGERKNAPEPDANTAIVDPAGLAFLQTGPAGAGGASGAIYRWLGIDSEPQFPADVSAAIKEDLRAKCHAYSQCAVIHVAAPDLRQLAYDNQPDEVVEALSIAYQGVIKEFLASKRKRLRICPISGGIFSGDHAERLPELTAKALTRAIVESKSINRLKKCELELCIYLEEDLRKYEAALVAEFGTM